MGLSSLLPWLPAVSVFRLQWVSCRRRWFIWKVPRPGCQWATASCSLGLPAGLSHLKKLNWLMLLSCSATTQLFRAFCFIHQGKGAAGQFLSLYLSNSLLTYGDRVLSTLLLKNLLYQKPLPWCYSAFRSLITVYLSLYSMFVHCKVQMPANKPAPGLHSVISCVIHKIASESVWNYRESLLFWSESFWTWENPYCGAKAGLP